MSIQYPIALILLAFVMPLIWVHQRGKGSIRRPFSLFFLLAAKDEGQSAQKDKIRSWPLFFGRLLTLLCLTAFVAGVEFGPGGGTIVLLDGPSPEDSSWTKPITYVRAGDPPSEVDSASGVRPVLSQPDWTAAAIFGRRIDPEGTLVIGEDSAFRDPEVSVGAAVDGDQVVVSAESDDLSPFTLHQGDRVFPMIRRETDWFYRGQLEPGAALVKRVGNQVGTWFCVPDASPMTVVRNGWPSEVHELLKTLPNIEFVDGDDAQWMVGESSPGVNGWAFAAPKVTRFNFSDEPTRSTAPLWFPRPLPNPGVVADRWRPLEDIGQPVLYAGAEVVADRTDSPQGRIRRFGFQPHDTGLPDSAAWPVLFLDALEEDRGRRSGCQEVFAGQSQLLWSETPVEIQTPSGRTQVLTPTNGHVVLGGLDEGGLYRLTSLDGVGQLVVKANRNERDVDRTWVPPPPFERSVDRRPLLWVTIGVLTCLLLLSWRRPWLLLIAAGCVLVGFFGPSLWGERGAVIVAVDVSGSMPLEETQITVRELENSLGDAVMQRVEGADEVRRVVNPLEPLTDVGGSTSYGPLLAAADELAGPEGVVILVGDGQSAESIARTKAPTFTLPVLSERPDAHIVDGEAISLGRRIFATVRVMSDRRTVGRLLVGQEEQSVSLNGTGIQTLKIEMADPGGDLRVSLEVENDRQPQNNHYDLPVDRPEAFRALFVGDGQNWLTYAGLNADRMSPGEFMESTDTLTDVRAIALVDVPRGALSVESLERLEAWVKAGGVLLLGGRTRAFAAGGWTETTLDRLSPLSLEPGRGSGKQLGVAVLLDRSGSISEEAGGIGLTKMGRLAAAVAGALEPQDQLAVIAFGGAVEVLQPTTKVADLDAVLPVPTRAVGGTRLLPALRAARTHLDSQGIDERIIVIATDGDFADQDEWALAGDELSARPGERIVALMVGDEPTMDPIKRVVGASIGSVTRVTDNLISIGLSRLREVESTGVFKSGGPVQPMGAWSSRVGGRPPIVGDMVRTGLKKGARSLASLRGEPLLAEWLFGRGRVIALSTDKWALSSTQWTALMSPASVGPVGGASVSIVGDTVLLSVGVARPSPVGHMISLLPDGRSLRTEFYPVGPGMSKASIPSGPMGIVSLFIESSAGEHALRVAAPRPQEWIQNGHMGNFLSLQAEMMGGAQLTGPNDVGAVLDARARRRPDALLACFGCLALAFLLLDAYLWSRRPQLV